MNTEIKLLDGSILSEKTINVTHEITKLGEHKWPTVVIRTGKELIIIRLEAIAYIKTF